MLVKGITKLSELTIDANKDWAAKGITNIKQVADLMSKGDLVQKGDTVLVRIPAGPDSYVLTAQGPGKLCSWAPAGGALKYYFPVSIDLTLTGLDIKTPDHLVAKTGNITSEHKQTYGDDVANYIKQLTPAVTLTDAEAIEAADVSLAETPPIVSTYGAQMIIDGAVADDGGVETNETAAAQSAAVNDMTLLPAIPAVGDAYMLGSRYPADTFWVTLGTQGNGNWTLVMKYWNGAWVSVVGEVTDSAQWMAAAGLRYWRHTPQIDWVTHVVQGMDLYWVRIEVTNYVNVVTQPKGTQSWWELLG